MTPHANTLQQMHPSCLHCSWRTTGKIIHDQTGRFPYTSNWGCTYFVVIYVYGANVIIAEHIKNFSHAEITTVYLKWYKLFTTRGFKPWLHKINNKTPSTIEHFIKKQQTTIQYTPPDMHRQNEAKRAIQNGKTSLSLTLQAPHFPPCSQLLPPNLSMQLHFEYVKTLLAKPKTFCFWSPLGDLLI